jgi:hypothetical protein
VTGAVYRYGVAGFEQDSGERRRFPALDPEPPPPPWWRRLLIPASYPGKVPLSSLYSVAWPQPFADHDRAVAMLKDYGDPTESASNPIFVASIASGDTVPLGTGDSVAGDPQAPGVFVAVAAPLGRTATSLAGSPNSAVLLRDAGHRPVMLATAAQLDRYLGLHGGALVMATHDPEVAERCDRILDLRVAAGSLS